eukprot:TRINITY_DN9786_c0_g1_i1.p6 TRINITY_DN9786_c0_g1~~TRINITY_DN9786_c0_g1_i1.p6  ORF type:complete len:107 (+),score=14.55 TRINITY_DN9786_c0_g1_i1:1706-2026(+)
MGSCRVRPSRLELEASKNGTQPCACKHAEDQSDANLYCTCTMLHGQTSAAIRKATDQRTQLAIQSQLCRQHTYYLTRQPSLAKSGSTADGDLALRSTIAVHVDGST